jgi:hypothetical protein
MLYEKQPKNTFFYAEWVGWMKERRGKGDIKSTIHIAQHCLMFITSTKKIFPLHLDAV